MNKHIYRQYDNRWRWLPYPNGGYYLNGSGCGCCAVTHCIIEMDKYKNWTPADVQPYMKQYAIRGNGTLWNGILKSLQHYGLKDVANIPTMPQLWRELEKGNRVGVLLFGNTKGPDGTVWTTGGHYIAFTDYRVKNGQHQLYLKDSGGRKHDGWYSYERSMRGDVRQVWIGRIPKGSEATSAPTTSTTKTTTTSTGKLTVDGQGGPATIRALQKYLKVTQDGVISGQNKSLHKYYTGIKSVKYGKGGSATVRAMQKWLGISADGIWGRGTSKALQKKLGVTADGYFGVNSVKALQKFLNGGGSSASTTKPSTSTTTKPTTSTTPAAPKPTTPTTTKTSNAALINKKALELAWPAGTPEKKYKKKGGGAPTSAFKTAFKKRFPNGTINTGCHTYVRLVLRETIDSKAMPTLTWSKIVSYFRNSSKYKEIKVNFKQSQLQPGDIRIHQNSAGGWHIWIITETGGKFYRAEANQGGKNERYAHLNGSTSGNTKKHKKDYLFRPV